MSGRTRAMRDGLLRRAWLVLLCGWLPASGCLCYGGGEPPPEDDDDATNNTDYPEYDLSGFYLDIGLDTGGDVYEGLVLLETGKLSWWSGVDGAHQEEEWLVTLSQGQLDALVQGIDPDAFFGASVDVAGEPDCFIEFRLGAEGNTAIHPAGLVPDELVAFYEALDSVLGLYDIEHGCS